MDTHIQEGEENEGALVKLTIGGCVAPLDQWKIAIPRWQSALDQEGIKCFHMVDFENCAEAFSGWGRNDERHRRLLNSLPEVIEGVELTMVGITASAAPIKRKRLRNTYIKSMAQAVNGSVTMVHNYYGRNPTNLVFARHGDFSGQTIGAFLMG